MSTIGKNIRKIRTVKKLSQASFAELFNLARPSVGAYEEERAEPKIETVIQIANHFGISIDGLLTKELTINELYKFDLHADELIQSKSEKKSKSTDSSKPVLVQAFKQIDYLVQNKSKDFLSGLPEIVIPGFEKEMIRAFELVTEEMHNNYQGLVSGDILIGKLIKSESHYKAVLGNIYIIITESEIIIRRLDRTGKNLLLKADNNNFSTREIAIENIVEMWEVVSFISKRINPPSLLYDRIMYLENAFEKMEKRIKSLEK